MRTSRFLVVGLVLALTLPPLPARGEDKPPAPLEGLHAAMKGFVESGDVAGAVTVVGRQAGVIDLSAVGLRDREAMAPMTADAVFRIASMTKPVTALGIMILADDKKLSVEDPVEKHLPEFRGQKLVKERQGDTVTLGKPPRPVTLRDLLTHTSGLPGGYPPGLADLYATRGRTLAEATLVASQQPLEFEPGTKWAYCNAGIDTLGRVIEAASGQPYEVFLKQRVFDPLGMKDTTFFPTPEQVKRVAVTYNKKEGRLAAEPASLLGLAPKGGHPVPAGGLYATGADLARLYRMMLGRGRLDGVRIVSEESVAAMTRVQTGQIKTGFVDGMGFGFGWAVVREPKGVTAVLSPGSYGHGGAFGTQGWIDPKRDLFVVLLIQRTGLPNADASEMRRVLQEHAVKAAGRKE